MKKLVCIVLSLVIVLGASTMVLAQSLKDNNGDAIENTENKVKTPYLESYEVNSENIKENDSANASIVIIDPNITESILISDGYIKNSDTSGFEFSDKNAAFEGNKVTYSEQDSGGKIEIKIDNIKYTGDGHKLSFTYGFNMNGSAHKNFMSFDVMETMPNTGAIEENKNIVEDCNDQKVLEAQQWLNRTYTGKKGFSPVPEDGKPGVILSQTFVVALQIELGIPDPTGTFGDATKAAFDSQVGALRIGSKDQGKNFVRLLQHALFCKGYSPTAVTGEFGEGTAGAVRSLKADAGISTSDESVNSMWYKAILNSDAYKLVNKGDSKIRSIQQTLNHDYNAYFGIMPCDGHYSRDTNKALIYAWQATEGLPVGTANGSFGPTTQAKSPNLPSDGRYSSAAIATFIRLMKYSLYCNNVKSSSSLPFDSSYGSDTIGCVKNFQDFMVLPQRDGKIYLGTMMSLMTSRGDPDRASNGCDCATQLDFNKAQDLYNAGYRYVGRYLTGTCGGKPKNLTIDECREIGDAGLKIFPIYQSGGAAREYFNYNQGVSDAQNAIQASKNLMIPANTIIYFAVDFDFMDVEVTQRVIPYFNGVNSLMRNSGYRVGVYGSRNICTRASNECGAVASFVSDMSTGYSGNYGYSMPINWAFDQFNEYDFSGGFRLDKDAVSGRDGGFKYPKGSYDRNKVRAYAQQWADPSDQSKYNPKYFHFGSDCANFVSQCLYEAGFGMNLGWYCAFDLKGETNNENISQPNSDPRYSNTWSVAKEQCEYFSEQSHGYILSNVVYINKDEDNPEEGTKRNIRQAIQDAKNQGLPIQIGDLMYFECPKKGPHHATIITNIDDNMIYYAGHTDSRFDNPLINVLKEPNPHKDPEIDTNVRIVRMNDKCFLD